MTSTESILRPRLATPLPDGMRHATPDPLPPPTPTFATTTRQPPPGTRCTAWHRLLPYPPRVMATFLGVELVVMVGYQLARHAIFPHHPNLRPLSFVLPGIITLALHHTLSSSTLTAYDKHLERRAGAPACELPQCAKCSRRRAQRSHHCRRCARCIPRMSHHCGVLGVCLGAHNLKPFLLLLLVAALSTGLVLSLTLPAAFRMLAGLWNGRLAITAGRLAFLQAVYVMYSLTLTFPTLLAFHLRLVAKNWTILECIARKVLWQVVLPDVVRARGRGWGKGAQIVSPYDRGSLWGNLADVFGRGAFALVPVVDVEALVVASRERAPLPL